MNNTKEYVIDSIVGSSRFGWLTLSATESPEIDCKLRIIDFVSHSNDDSLRSRRYSRAQGGKLEIPPAQKLSILSSAHRAHGSARTNVFALENQSERELLIMLLAGLQCSKRCQFNNCFVFFCHGEQNNSHEIFVKAYTVNIVHFPTPVGKIAITSLPQETNVGLIFFAHTSSRWVDR